MAEEGFTRSHHGNEFRAPDVSSTTGNGEFMRIAIAHVHDICHEGESRELVRELAAEEPEIGKRRIYLLKVFECNSIRDPFVLNCCKGFHP